MQTLDITDSFNYIEQVCDKMAQDHPDRVVLCKAFSVDRGSRSNAVLQMKDCSTDEWKQYNKWPRDKWEAEANVAFIDWFNSLN
jgi:hypothetical protein